MPSEIRTWIRRLSKLRLTSLRFAGGALRIRYRDEDATDPESGIQYLAQDHVAVSTGERMFFIPYAALRSVRGSTQSSRHRFVKKVLRLIITEWVDPTLDPKEDMIWHSLISRKGKHFQGAILKVSRSNGVRLRLADNRIFWLRWDRIGAATEILE